MAILCLSRYYIFLKYSCSEGISVKIILAPDSFKGNLTSLEVAVAFEKGIRRVLPNGDYQNIPLFDFK